MKLHKFHRSDKREKRAPAASSVQTARRTSPAIPSAVGGLGGGLAEMELYDALRENVPIIDAAILKIIRLAGGCTVSCSGSTEAENQAAERALGDFLRFVPVGGVSMGLESFLCAYFDDLLTYGNAAGEIVLDRERRQIAGLYNANLRELEIQPGSNPLRASLSVREEGFRLRQVRDSGLILFTALNPKPGEVSGNSILKGLPFVTRILMRIFTTTEQNFERIGNVRYAVTYRPGSDPIDRSYASERAAQIAREWSRGMSGAKNGSISDFVCSGDVDIRVIGADNQLIDTQIPVRQMLEQIIAKLGIPPFLLGLSWSTTERMSKQQADILTSEIGYYRRLLSPVVLRICETFLRLEGYACKPELKWSVVNLQDESEYAKARLYNAQAEKLEQENSGGETAQEKEEYQYEQNRQY